jgi:outer membrane protein assembly factor BamB
VKLSNNIKKIFLLLTVLILGLSLLVSCMGTSTAARGWAGGAVSDGKLFVASMKGKIIAIDANDTKNYSTIQLVVPTSGGLSCLPSSCGGQSSYPLVMYASPVVRDTIVYVGGTDGKIYGYSFADNKLLEDPEWLYPRQGNMVGVIIGGIILANDRVYFVTSDGTVYALKADGLYKEWTYEIGEKVWSTPVVDGNTLYIGSFNKKLYALDATDGTKKWEYETSGAINSTPIVYDNKVYIGDYSRHFYALDAATGTLVWKFPTTDKGVDNPQNWFWAKPLVLNGVIYAPCLDGNVYALNASTGNLVHKYVLSDVIDSSPLAEGDSIVSSPVAIGDYIVVATTHLYKNRTGKVYIINTLDKSEKMLDVLTEGINAPLFAKDSIVYVHTTKDNLYWIDAEAKDSKLELLYNLSTMK